MQIFKKEVLAKITQNPLYENFGKTIESRRPAYKEYVSTTRPYEEMIDRQFWIHMKEF